jgi:hypothetical protein
MRKSLPTKMVRERDEEIMLKLDDSKFQNLKTYLETQENVDESNVVFGSFIKYLKKLHTYNILDECYRTPLTDRGLKF